MRLPVHLPPKTGRQWDVLAVGENSEDLLLDVDGHPPQGAKVRARRAIALPGGQTATAAAALARLGWPTAYAGAVGDDEAGRRAVESLRAEGVDCAPVVVVPGAATRGAVILVDARSGERTVIWHQDTRLGEAAIAPPVERARVLLVDDGGDVALAAARRARAAGTRTVIDIDAARPGVITLLAEIDVVIAAEGVAEALTEAGTPGAALAALQAACGAAIVCATLGADGSLARVAGREVRTPGFRVPVVDTTGAGDLFRAGFIAGWLAAGEAAEAGAVLRYANAVAALGCRALGARGSLPRRDEVDALLRGEAAPK